jgi:hypothetical protein
VRRLLAQVRFSRAPALIAFFVIMIPRLVSAQGDEGPDPASVRMRIGPVLINPRLALTNLGFDSNVFNEPSDIEPKKDFTATITPTTDIWMRLGRSWFQFNIKEDLVWYQRYASERSANTSYTLNWKMMLNRVAVTVSPRYTTTRERPGFEIDARSQRKEYGGTLTSEVRGLSKTFFGVTATYRKVDFDQDATFLGTNLHDELNRTERSAGIAVRHQLTPLTAVKMSVSQEQDRFDYSPLRDSNSTQASLAVSFDPHALLKGSATIGYRNFHPLVSGLPDYSGTTLNGDLSYSLLGATRFQAQFRRDVNYSYEINEPYYLETGVNGSVAQQVFGPFDVIARAGTAQLAYRARVGALVAVSNRVDYIRTYGLGVGYHMSKDLRLGFNIDQQNRISDVTERRYDGLKYGTAVTYAF